MDPDSTSLVDPLTGLGNRVKLMADMAEALQSESQESLFAIFSFAGIGGHGRRRSDRASQTALLGCFATLSGALTPAASCYRLRGAEFSALIRAPLADATALVEEAVNELADPGTGSDHAVTFGFALLPHEVSDPTDVLMLADERLIDSLRGTGSLELAELAS